MSALHCRDPERIVVGSPVSVRWFLSARVRLWLRNHLSDQCLRRRETRQSIACSRKEIKEHTPPMEAVMPSKIAGPEATDLTSSHLDLLPDIAFLISDYLTWPYDEELCLTEINIGLIWSSLFLTSTCYNCSSDDHLHWLLGSSESTGNDLPPRELRNRCTDGESEASHVAIIIPWKTLCFSRSLWYHLNTDSEWLRSQEFVNVCSGTLHCRSLESLNEWMNSWPWMMSLIMPP